MNDREAFLGKNYSRPSSGGSFFQPEKGNTKVRILTPPVFGYVAWKREGDSKLPVHIRLDEKFDFKPEQSPKYFWGVLIWNFKENAIQLWVLSKATIISKLETLLENDEYGDPRGYNITVTRKGDGMDTEYDVVPSPKSELAEEIKKAMEETKLNPESIFTKKEIIGGTDGPDNDDEISIENVPF